MILFGLPAWLVLTFLFILGAVIGSFLNVCIYRIPQREGFWDSLRGLNNPPSSCPYCRNRIAPYDNIPILGWILLRGRCRQCRRSISIRYPAIELFNALLFVLVYWFEVPFDWSQGIEGSSLYTPLGPHAVHGPGWLSASAVLHWRYAYHMVLIEALVVATFIDFDLWIIPDGVTLPAMAVGFLGATVIGQVYIVPVWFERGDLSQFLNSILVAFGWMDPVDVFGPGFLPASSEIVVPAWVTAHPHLHGLAFSLAGFVVGGGVVWIVRLIGGCVLRQEAMGFGDVVLMAAVGAFLGWQPTLLVFFLAPLCALAVVAVGWLFLPQREIPYGPYLSLAALLVLLFWPHVWPGAEEIFKLGWFVPVLGVLMALAMFVSLYLLQGLKWMLGMNLPLEAWTNAPPDQFKFLSAEGTDAEQGWPLEGWRGTRTGEGTAHRHEWRHNPSAHGWQQHWQRRPGPRS